MVGFSVPSNVVCTLSPWGLDMLCGVLLVLFVVCVCSDMYVERWGMLR